MKNSQEYWNILNSTQEGIRYSDTKATIILTLLGVVLTLIYSNSEQVLIALTASKVVMWFSILSIVCATISIFFAFLCINPKLNNNKNPKSIIYFGHIQQKHKNYKDYYSTSNKIMSNEIDYNEELAEQIYFNSQIAWAKFSNVAWCIRFLFGCILFIILSLVSYLI